MLIREKMIREIQKKTEYGMLGNCRLWPSKSTNRKDDWTEFFLNWNSRKQKITCQFSRECLSTSDSFDNISVQFSQNDSRITRPPPSPPPDAGGPPGRVAAHAQTQGAPARSRLGNAGNHPRLQTTGTARGSSPRPAIATRTAISRETNLQAQNRQFSRTLHTRESPNNPPPPASNF